MTLGSEREGRPVHAAGRRLPDNVTPAWAGAFASVPRSLFLPDLIWAHDMATGTNRALARSVDGHAWSAAAEADVPVVTQWDDGTTEAPNPISVPTSSASMPSLVASMLRDLDVDAGMRVLEIGTGTGWNAALLAHRLGDRNVFSVEIDDEVAVRARAMLGVAGFAPTVVCGDGRLGWPAGAPYDRIIATCGLRRIPYAWLEQARAGGVILAPWGTHYGHQDALVRLSVAADGTASGPFLAPVQFMKLRAHRLHPPRHPDFPGDAVESSTTVRPPLGDWEAFTFVAGLMLPGVTHLVHRREDGVTVLWLYSLTDDSWAAVFYDEEAVWDVYQSGRRRLWGDLEAVHEWWLEQDAPEIDRFGLTVSAEQETAWLDEPGNELLSGREVDE
ncbi:methyltransferase domain-containing protein [Kitasatospora sp. NPDC006697]|uniref:methyltransferase domain-containing protein n=1 Tax=Kitasatospora sp. NPDC006697 TaxID=3364020 RepID=UPI00369D4B05